MYPVISSHRDHPQVMVHSPREWTSFPGNIDSDLSVFRFLSERIKTSLCTTRLHKTSGLSYLEKAFFICYLSFKPASQPARRFSHRQRCEQLDYQDVSCHFLIFPCLTIVFRVAFPPIPTFISISLFSFVASASWIPSSYERNSLAIEHSRVCSSLLNGFCRIRENNAVFPVQSFRFSYRL